jgi:Ca2+-binding EF-hand superfamily protein
LRAFKTAVPGVSPEIVADVFREADVDSDGKVGAEAFEKLFTAGSLPR